MRGCHVPKFNAIVVERHERELQIAPIDRRVTYHHVKAREVVETWHKRRRRNGAGLAEPNDSA